jgi:DNL zinc finger
MYVCATGYILRVINYSRGYSCTSKRSISSNNSNSNNADGVRYLNDVYRTGIRLPNFEFQRTAHFVDNDNVLEYTICKASSVLENMYISLKISQLTTGLFLLCSLSIAVHGWIPNCNPKHDHRLQSQQDVYHKRQNRRLLLSAKRRNLNMNDDDDDDSHDDDSCRNTASDGIPQLPPIGATSMSNKPSSGMTSEDNPFVANHKFQIQYTCNICETRNTNTISRLAYRQGVVIARCKGCQNQHLIADHLGWTDYAGGFQGNQTNTIEDYFANDANNKTNVTVNRVNTDVFELEKILQYNAGKSGAIVGDDALE